MAFLTHSSAMGLFLLLALGFALLYVGILAYTLWMLTHPPRRTYASALARGRPGDPSELEIARPFESWMFRSRNLELPVWDIQGDSPSGPTIILSHGWGDSRIGAMVRIPHLAPLAARLITWELPGHGEAPATSTLGAFEAQDLLALIEHLGPEARPILYGWSLGAGISLDAAAQASATAITAIIAESAHRFPETPARNVLRNRGLPWRATLPAAIFLLNLRYKGRLSRSRFDRTFLASKVASPILILHGDCDEVCPIEDGRQIAAAAPRATLAEIPTGRHNDLWTAPDLAAQSAEQIRNFVDALASESRSR